MGYVAYYRSAFKIPPYIDIDIIGIGENFNRSCSRSSADIDLDIVP
ncbi:hypothetical protein [Methanolobus psychrotolerans]|nr:hypothetical protein [Methanolobus psychrotolerans]